MLYSIAYINFFSFRLTCYNLQIITFLYNHILLIVVYKCLAEFLKTRKGKYVLFLGAGASISSGGRTTQEIIDGIIERYELDSKNSWNSFCNFLRKTGVKERHAALSKYFEDMKPSTGYEILAKLIDEGYFRLILTTNFDFMLEECLKKTKLVLNKDYFICIVDGEKKVK